MFVFLTALQTVLLAYRVKEITRLPPWLLPKNIQEDRVEIKQVEAFYVEKHPFNRSVPHTSEK